MQEVVANVDNICFNIERALELQLGAQPLPFPGMDKSGSAICAYFIASTCSKGINCPFRHVRGERSIVCKHWLRGLCKKGDNCEFLHEYDMQKMPECYFYSRFGECGNKDCPFLHIDPEQKVKVCPWYNRGFCRHGALCKNRHVRKVMCLNYLCGFCLDGPNCKYVHPRFEIPFVPFESGQQQAKKVNFTCHYCNETGHKAVGCPRLLPSLKREHAATGANIEIPIQNFPGQQQLRPHNPGGIKHDLRPLDQVTCFKCGERGHYANKCPKGHLAFLSHLAPHHHQKPPSHDMTSSQQQQQHQHQISTMTMPPPQQLHQQS